MKDVPGELVKKESLFNLSQDVVALDELMENITSTEDAEAALQMQQILYLQIQNKVDGCEEYVKMLEFAQEHYQAKLYEARDLQNKAHKKIEKFKKYLKSCLDFIGVNELKGERNKITLRKGLEKVEVTDENEIPVEFLRTKTVVEVDKVKLLAALKNGQEVPGALLVRGESTIQFKTLI